MENDTNKSEAGRLYWAAYEMHYQAKSLAAALELYQEIITGYPSTEEAKYSRTQMTNIVKVVVPKEALFDSQVSLARFHMKKQDPSNEAAELA